MFTCLHLCLENSAEPEAAPGQQEEAPPAEESGAGLPSGRRNPPGGKSSLILGWIPADMPSKCDLWPSSPTSAPVCTAGILSGVERTAVCSACPSALFWYLFVENWFVLVSLFVLSTLCIFIYTVQSLPPPLHPPTPSEALQEMSITFRISRFQRSKWLRQLYANMLLFHFLRRSVWNELCVFFPCLRSYVYIFMHARLDCNWRHRKRF